MSCPSPEELIRKLDGELTFNRALELDRHLASCPPCAAIAEQLARIVRRLGPPPAEALAGIQAGVRTRIQRGDEVPAVTHAPRPRRVVRWLAPSLGAAAALVLLLVAKDRLRPTVERPIRATSRAAAAEFHARGALDAPESAARLQVWIFGKRDANQQYQRVGPSFDRASHLAFALYVPPGSARFLVLFAVDGASALHWYYPGSDDAAGRSVRLAQGRQQLPDEVRHELALGRVQVFALLTVAPLSVRAVERVVADWRAGRPEASRTPSGLPRALGALAGPAGALWTRSFDVTREEQRR